MAKNGQKSKACKWLLLNKGLIVLVLITGLLIGIAIVLYLTQSTEKAAQAGDLVAGFSGASALLWLVAGYYQQSRELSLQRKELELQRRALEAQTKELARTSKLSALGQVKLILKDADEYIAKSKATAKNSNELALSITTVITELAVFVRSVSAQKIQEHYQLFLPTKNAAESLLGSVRSAMLLYAEADPKIQVQPNDDPRQFVLQNDNLIRSVPYLSNYQGNAWSIAHTLITFEPGFKNIELAGMTALILLAENPEIVHREPMKKLYEEVITRGDPPAICSLFDFENHKIR